MCDEATVGKARDSSCSFGAIKKRTHSHDRASFPLFFYLGVCCSVLGATEFTPKIMASIINSGETIEPYLAHISPRIVASPFPADTRSPTSRRWITTGATTDTARHLMLIRNCDRLRMRSGYDNADQNKLPSSTACKY